MPVEPVLEQINQGELPASADLLAALIGRLNRAGVEQLLSGPVGRNPACLLEAARQVLAPLAAEPSVKQAWLEPLLALPPSPAGLGVLGYFQDACVAGRLRAQLEAIEPSERKQEAMQQLLPLLGRQRQPQDAGLLLELALAPAPLAWRRAALEALALGLSAWPLAPLTRALQQLAGDLDPGLAAQAVDLLSRLPDGQMLLRQLQHRQLEPAVAERLRRRLTASPLVLLVHGRQGGVIPVVLQQLAAELEKRRRSPVILQAFTAAAPEGDPSFWMAARRAGALSLVPLLLLPGEHVRSDVPAIARHWQLRSRARLGQVVALRRRPFLGAWPQWQQLLAAEWGKAAGGRSLLWLHHPLQGALADRFLKYLAGVLALPGAPAAYSDPQAILAAQAEPPVVLAPLTLAPNRLSESLKMVRLAPPAEVLPPLLDLPAVRDFLLSSLEALP
ncbi:CbiX/SirB N-terminal domain-containing protein [Cyanobium sp. HWJ4-Hawea]|uniref:CbiX/SirB N-terminal domain-containing protein n=1 Tax=Cyanobium sp. HWJ4-Hawea TaxID=2823713 RepID=UPI0020CE7239|nr:CbiX/SirB N-terminal domain-containing protein [Cyanobium sp. HWJ4-Hawea]